MDLLIVLWHGALAPARSCKHQAAKTVSTRQVMARAALEFWLTIKAYYGPAA